MSFASIYDVTVSYSYAASLGLQSYSFEVRDFEQREQDSVSSLDDLCRVIPQQPGHSCTD